ncbi:MAG: hypothetical protein V5A47_12740 [Bacteroidales bacterium]|nr:hypothetical protein [Bacteroidales bacterium]MBS3777037.1 hypothetical protein [Bacteroidales bacterium]
MIRIRKNIISVLLIAVIAGITINSTINAHYHKLPDGEVIHHSHPYKEDTSDPDSPFQKHHHSPSEYFLFHQITNEPYIPSEGLSIVDVHFISSAEIDRPVYSIHDVASSVLLYSSPRAPPYKAC